MRGRMFVTKCTLFKRGTNMGSKEPLPQASIVNLRLWFQKSLSLLRNRLYGDIVCVCVVCVCVSERERKRKQGKRVGKRNERTRQDIAPFKHHGPDNESKLRGLLIPFLFPSRLIYFISLPFLFFPLSTNFSPPWLSCETLCV